MNIYVLNFIIEQNSKAEIKFEQNNPLDGISQLPICCV